MLYISFLRQGRPGIDLISPAGGNCLFHHILQQMSSFLLMKLICHLNLLLYFPHSTFGIQVKYFPQSACYNMLNNNNNNIIIIIIIISPRPGNTGLMSSWG